MAPADVGRRAARRVALLVAAVLAALAVCVPSTGTAEPLNTTSTGVSEAVAPVSSPGRPAAAPSVLRSFGPAASMPFAQPPNVVTQAVLARLDRQLVLLVSAPYAARRPAGGDRAPPGSGIA